LKKTARATKSRTQQTPRKHLKMIRGSSSEHAYLRLRDSIVSLELEPGTNLDEASAVARLGLSRTPVREAIVRLAAEGLVQLLPNRGARVAPMGWDDIREHLEAFDIIQRLITRWSALRRSEANLAKMEELCTSFEQAQDKSDSAAMLQLNWDFHAAIAAGCRNSVMEEYYLRLLTGNLRISRLAMSYEAYTTAHAYHSHVGNIRQEHRELVQAIRVKDADRAERLARSHANLARKRVTETLTQSLTDEMAIAISDNAA